MIYSCDMHACSDQFVDVDVKECQTIVWPCCVISPGRRRCLGSESWIVPDLCACIVQIVTYVSDLCACLVQIVDAVMQAHKAPRAAPGGQDPPPQEKHKIFKDKLAQNQVNTDITSPEKSAKLLGRSVDDLPSQAFRIRKQAFRVRTKWLKILLP